MSPSHGLQLFTNYPSVGPSHGVQSFRNRLLQCGSPHGVTSPASKPALVWVPLSTGPQVLAEVCCSVGSPQGHSLLQTSTCFSLGSLPRATDGYLLHHGPPWAAGEQPASPWSSQVASEESLLLHLEHLLPPPSSLTLVSAELFLSHRLTPLSSLLFYCRFFSSPS